jgi:hypothetical protein
MVRRDINECISKRSLGWSDPCPIDPDAGNAVVAIGRDGESFTVSLRDGDRARRGDAPSCTGCRGDAISFFESKDSRDRCICG